MTVFLIGSGHNFATLYAVKCGLHFMPIMVWVLHANNRAHLAEGLHQSPHIILLFAKLNRIQRSLIIAAAALFLIRADIRACRCESFGLLLLSRFRLHVPLCFRFRLFHSLVLLYEHSPILLLFFATLPLSPYKYDESDYQILREPNRYDNSINSYSRLPNPSFAAASMV